MAQQANSSEINSSPAVQNTFLQSTIASLRMNLVVFSKTLPFIYGLIVSYKFVDVAVVFILIDYLGDSWQGHNQQLAVVVTNLQDALSSFSFVIVSQISEEYTGYFKMIACCAPVSVLGLVLLWTSTSPSAFGAFYAALVLLALGKGGQTLLEKFLEYQLKDHVEDTGRTICSFVPSCVVYIMTLYIAFEKYWTYNGRFRFAAFFMLGTYVSFLVGSVWYSDDEMCAESKLRKIYKTSKAAFGKWKTKYPTSPNFYYWKDYKQGHLYEHDKGLRLLPRVPQLFRWLDKAAIIEEEVSSETQEEKGKLCAVKEVREVKSLVPMIYLGYTLFGYSFVLASGNTFFVAQAISSKSVITDIDGNDISILLLIMDVMDKMSRFIYVLILRCLKNSGFIDFEPQDKKATIIRVGLGMVCAVICCVIAELVEVHRSSLPWTWIIKDETEVKRRGRSSALVPQFILLGMANGLVEGGFINLFYGHVAKSMWSFADSFTELVIGIGKLLIIPVFLVFNRWLNGEVDTRRLHWYFFMLGTVNVIFLVIFTYYSFTYAYNEVCPEDEAVTTEQRPEHAQHPNSVASNQENAGSPLEERPTDDTITGEQTLELVHQPNSQDSYLENDNGPLWINLSRSTSRRRK